jgi:hypothetical protein
MLAVLEAVDLLPFQIDVETAWRHDRTLAALHEQLEAERALDRTHKNDDTRAAMLDTLDHIAERKREIRRGLVDAA